jgi:glucose uptake protein
MTLIAAILVIGAWGVWLMPASKLTEIPQLTVVLYATLANLVVAGGVLLVSPATSALSGATLLAIAGGGVMWTVGAVAAFTAVRDLGPARAMGLWSPLNILVSLAWGAYLFGEFNHLTALRLGLAVGGTILLIAGIIALIRAREPVTLARFAVRGTIYAAAVGVLWGSYFLPIRLTGISAAEAAFPLAVGMAGTAVTMALIQRELWRVPSVSALFRLLATGGLWAIGNYASLLLMALIGTGRGFAVAQLCLVVNALIGIHFLRRPAPGSLAARQVIGGCILAATGGILLGLSR